MNLRPQINNLEKDVLEILREKPATVLAIAKLYGVDSNPRQVYSLRRTVQRLRQKGLVEETGFFNERWQQYRIAGAP